jgi:hypothetical protein
MQYKIQRKISEQLWKSNYYKYGYFGKGSQENEVSEIREDPNEDYEENLTKIICLDDSRNPVQTEGIEVEEISVD